MRWWLAASGCLLMGSSVCGLACGQLSEFPPPVVVKNEEAYERLEEPISIDYFEIRFGDILIDLQEKMGQQFVLHESARECNLDEDTLLTLSLKKLRGCTMLRYLLQPYQCTYKIDDGLVIIISQDEAYTKPSRYVIHTQTDTATMERLKSLIKKIIDPGSWNEKAGRGQIESIENKLVVSQTEENIRAIRDLLFVLDAIDR